MGGKQSKQPLESLLPNQSLEQFLKEGIWDGMLFGRPIDADSLAKISDFDPRITIASRRVAAAAKSAGSEDIRNKTITKRLLQAVAYGMESKEANEPVQATDAGHLFKSHLFAKDLLQKSPEFLLARGDVTDLAGRTFKNITAFEYALWAKDFKMIAMMFHCIPTTSVGDVIWSALRAQAEQVKAQIAVGGGITYTHTYDRPNVDARGIPDGSTVSVTVEYTENHFDFTPICTACQDSLTHFNARTRAQRDAHAIYLIGKLQRLLPIHLLQYACAPASRSGCFSDAPKRRSFYFDIFGGAESSILHSALGSECVFIFPDFPFERGQGQAFDKRWRDRYLESFSSIIVLPPGTPPCWSAKLDNFEQDRAACNLDALRQVDAALTNNIEKLMAQLSEPQHRGECRP